MTGTDDGNTDEDSGQPAPPSPPAPPKYEHIQEGMDRPDLQKRKRPSR